MTLAPKQINPRLLGHFGTTPGLNLIYVHLNRVIRERDLNAIYVCGPGHAGQGMVANTYLEETYSELYAHAARNVNRPRSGGAASSRSRPGAILPWRPNIRPPIESG